MADYFETLGIEKKLNIDAKELERIYYDLSRKNHPDFHTGSSEEDFLKSVDTSSEINKAYKTLKDPLSRANYIIGLELAGETDGKDKQVPQELLMEVMEIQEKTEDYKNAGDDEKESIKNELKELKESLEEKLSEKGSSIEKMFGEYDNDENGRVELLKRMKAEIHKRNYINTLIRTIDREVFGGEAIIH